MRSDSETKNKYRILKLIVAFGLDTCPIRILLQYYLERVCIKRIPPDTQLSE